MTAPYQPMKRSILDRLASRLFPTLGLMSPEEGQAVGRQGLLQLGTNLLQAGGASPQQAGTLANIGRSIAGVDVNALTKQALTLQAYRQQQAANQKIAEVTSRHPLKPGATPEEVYNTIAAMVPELIGIPGTEDYLGKLGNLLAQLRPQRELRSRYVFKNLSEGGGKWGYYRINQDDPDDRIRLSDGTPPTGQGLATQEQGRRQALAAMATNAISALDAVGQKPPTFWEELAGSALGQKVGGQAVLSEGRQIQNQANNQFTEAVLRFTTGAVAPEHELQNYLRTLTLRAFDKPGLVTRKANAQRTLLAALQRLAARGDPYAPIDPNEAVLLLQQAAGSVVSGGAASGEGQSGGINPRFDPRRQK